MPPTGKESDEQTRALTGRKLNAEESNPARGAAGRPRQDGGAKADFRVRFGGFNFGFESSGHYYRGGCDGGSSGGGRR